MLGFVPQPSIKPVKLLPVPEQLQKFLTTWPFRHIINLVDRQTKTKYEARAKIIKALAHPTRLFIIDQLAQGKRCVCELTKMIGADMSTVSKHLSVMKNAGIVYDEKVGTKIFYHLRCTCITPFFGCIESVIKQNIMAQMESIE